MPTIPYHLKTGFKVLSESGVAEPQREASLLLEFALAREKTFLIAHSEYEPTPDEEKKYTSFLERRARREPFQYITGEQEFFGLDFVVTPDVLIPRPETEMLVEAAIGHLGKLDRPTFCEIGVGSGCIAVSVLKNVPAATAVAGDISDMAIKVARSNAERHGVAGRLKLISSDIFEGIGNEVFDLIVSNPPYVPVEEISGLQPEVRDHEPHTALSDGGDGLAMIRAIIDGASKFLKPGGWLLIEIGFGQSGKVLAMFDPEIWMEFDARPDFQDIPRMVAARLK
ncbi:MAG TPA: peptide chain release factor N(5)-glutamine methyltransferase [Pyrinomonadaceae bacterium]|nr:peptide chain release factor N(5)-glutamine methyltransferase [Pyrinomonadaceae bacterium]